MLVDLIPLKCSVGDKIGDKIKYKFPLTRFQIHYPEYHMLNNTNCMVHLGGVKGKV